MQQLIRIMMATKARPGRSRHGRRCYSRHADRLVEFFVLHRVAVSGQVERAFRDLLHSDRSTRMHLQTLVEAGDLTVGRERGIGQPNVYRITERCLRRMTDEQRDNSVRVTRQCRRLGNHLVHELLTTELGVAVATGVRLRPDLQLLWHDRFGLRGMPPFANLVPDFAFLFRHKGGMMMCLAEVSSGEESTRRLDEKIQQYAAWAGTTLGQRFLIDAYRREGAQAPRPQFRLVFVLQNRRTGNDQARLKQTLAAGIRSSPDILKRMWLTTAAELCQTPWLDRPIWVRGADFESLAARWPSVPRSDQRRTLRSELSVLPNHLFFPSPQVP